MRRTITIISLLLLMTAASYAQFTKIGGGLFYDHKYYFNNEAFSDHKLGNPAIFVTGIYEINLPFHIAPRISMFMPNITKTSDVGYTSKLVISGYSLDIDGHYVFNSLDRFEIYGLAGLNILYVHRKSVFESPDFNEKLSDSNTSFGLNAGIGTYFKLKDQFDLYGEVKAIVASQVQVVATVGILLNVGWLKNSQESEF